MQRRRVAVIGSGVAGLTAAYILQAQADVTLYEADARLGGHNHTHDLTDDAGHPVNVDTGFIVHNAKTYPNLLRLFRELEVATQESEMSMSISCGGCGLQYAGAHGLSGLFPSAHNAARPRYLYMLGEVVRFHRRARALLDEPGSDETMSEFLQRGHFSRYFHAHFVTPLISAVWSCSPELARQYPARYLFEFLSNHGMLSVTGSPQWRTVVGGSNAYVSRAVKHLTSVQTVTPIREVRRLDQRVEVRDDADQVATFDSVVIATHPDQALRLLADPSAMQTRLLGAMHYSTNPTVLHSDSSVLPRASRAQASWNYYLPQCEAAATAVQVTYDMNRLQRLSSGTRFLVTLNDDCAISEDAVLDRMVYQHPIFTPESVAAQAELPLLNDSVVAFAGAYHGWGFHEDGCRSGVEAARDLGDNW